MVSDELIIISFVMQRYVIFELKKLQSLCSPSDEGVCHSPDREASSCDSGYHSCRYEEWHRVAFNDKGDNGPHSRHLIPHTSTRPLNVSYYDNTRGAERHVSDPLSMTTTEKKPKGILKKRNYEQGGFSTQILSVESG